MSGDENTQWITWLREQRASYLGQLDHANRHFCCAHKRDPLETCIRMVGAELTRRGA